MQPLFLAILLGSSCLSMAQSESEIRQHYQEVNQQITAAKEQGFEGPLYHNQWVVNKTGKSWPAVGRYSETTDFWYDDPPDHLPASERKPEKVLLKIHLSRTSSHLTAREEYLFRDGKLLFYFRQEGEEGREWETRVYFNSKGMAFKTVVKANGRELNARDFLTEEYRDVKPEPHSILAGARKLQDFFLKGH